MTTRKEMHLAAAVVLGSLASLAGAFCPNPGFLEEGTEFSSSEGSYKHVAFDGNVQTSHRSQYYLWGKDDNPHLQVEMKEQLDMQCDDVIMGVRIKVPSSDKSQLKVQPCYLLDMGSSNRYCSIHTQNLKAYVSLIKMDPNRHSF